MRGGGDGSEKGCSERQEGLGVLLGSGQNQPPPHAAGAVVDEGGVGDHMVVAALDAEPGSLAAQSLDLSPGR